MKTAKEIAKDCGLSEMQTLMLERALQEGGLPGPLITKPTLHDASEIIGALYRRVETLEEEIETRVAVLEGRIPGLSERVEQALAAAKETPKAIWKERIRFSRSLGLCMGALEGPRFQVAPEVRAKIDGILREATEAAEIKSEPGPQRESDKV